MRRFVAPVTPHLDVKTDDDACPSDATASQQGVEASVDLPALVSGLSVIDGNQDEDEGELGDVADSNPKLLSASHSESTATTQSLKQAMGLQHGRQALVSTMTSTCVKVPGKAEKSSPNASNPGPTLGAVMEAVSRNETDIQELDFSFLLKRNKRLETEGCALVARALETNRTVRRLILREHDVGDQGAAAIAAMMCRNSTLEYVDLCGNSITDKGAEALAQALYGHASLTHLQLWSNHITDRGAKALADAIKCNCSLLYLGLVQNSITQAGAQALLDALDVNIQLQTLNLATNEQVPAWLIAQIRAVLARNRLEAPRIRAALEFATTPESAGGCTKQSEDVSRQENDNNIHDDIGSEGERNYTSSSSGSARSGFLSCSGVTASAINGDGIWI